MKKYILFFILSCLVLAISKIPAQVLINNINNLSASGVTGTFLGGGIGAVDVGIRRLQSSDPESLFGGKQTEEQRKKNASPIEKENYLLQRLAAI